MGRTVLQFEASTVTCLMNFGPTLPPEFTRMGMALVLHATVAGSEAKRSKKLLFWQEPFAWRTIANIQANSPGVVPATELAVPTARAFLHVVGLHGGAAGQTGAIEGHVLRERAER